MNLNVNFTPQFNMKKVTFEVALLLLLNSRFVFIISGPNCTVRFMRLGHERIAHAAACSSKFMFAPIFRANLEKCRILAKRRERERERGGEKDEKRRYLRARKANINRFDGDKQGQRGRRRRRTERSCKLITQFTLEED